MVQNREDPVRYNVHGSSPPQHYDTQSRTDRRGQALYHSGHGVRTTSTELLPMPSGQQNGSVCMSMSARAQCR